jgi:hypothetical protein
MRSQPHIAASPTPFAPTTPRSGARRRCDGKRIVVACSDDPMADRFGADHSRRMPDSLVRPHARRAPDNELFDRACDLLDAAGAIRSAAGAPQAARAAPAVLACLEAALRELALTASALEQISAQAIDSGTNVRRDAQSDVRVGRMHRGYGNLRQALVDAERASSAARALTARALGDAPTV